jgi:hypothetical protein
MLIENLKRRREKSVLFSPFHLHCTVAFIFLGRRRGHGGIENLGDSLESLRDSKVFEVGAVIPPPAREKAKKATAQMPPYFKPLTE